MINVAILIDGGFYRRKAHTIWGEKTPKDRASELYSYCKKHLKQNDGEYRLYRIFYYDCKPSDKKVYHPIQNSTIDLGKSKDYKWNTDFFKELTHQRKFAMRLGHLSNDVNYNLRYEATKKLVSKDRDIDSLTMNDFELNIIQKGVDMMIGVDIASLVFKKQVQQIILISADSDFVPAAKLARREGVDFILDPMLSKIGDDLYEHIDGLRTKVNIHKKNSTQQEKEAESLPLTAIE